MTPTTHLRIFVYVSKLGRQFSNTGESKNDSIACAIKNLGNITGVLSIFRENIEDPELQTFCIKCCRLLN
jgi:hypothetical protein